MLQRFSIVKDKMQRNNRISFDVEELTGQAKELADLCKARFSEGIPSDLVSDFAELSLDVVLGNSRSTIGTDGTQEVLITFHFADRFERLRAAVFACESGIVGH